MGKSGNKTKKFYLFAIIYFLFILILCGTIFYLWKQQEELKTKKHNNHVAYAKLEKEYRTLQKETDGLKSEVSDLKDLDRVITSKKENVFLLASALEKDIQDKKSDAKIAYLTFDDGPYYVTNQFLDILDKYQVRATFFTIGLEKDECYDRKGEDCSTLYKKEADKGHTVANHTYNHALKWGLYNSVDGFIKQVKLQDELIKKRTGYNAKIVRFPGGSASAKGLKNSIIQSLKDNGYGWVDWTAMDGDGGLLSSQEQAWSNFTKTIDSPLEVILLHDYNDITLSLLPKFIEYLEEEGYILLPLFYDSVMVNK